jgi:SAM-dependent methyltransferase
MPASTFTGGRGSRLRSYAEITAHQAQVTNLAATIAFNAWKHHQPDLPPGGRVLEIGCGSRAGSLILHHTAGAVATGIDFDDPRPGLRGIVGQLRSNGFERAAKTAARRVLFDRGYYRELSRLYGAPLRRKGLDVRRMDARRLEFANNEFDLIYSIAVFEHIDSVDDAAAEVARVLKPGGVALLHAHLFRSLSGGHNLAWADVENPPESPPPWDHLREQLAPTHVYLNKLRGPEFLEIFSRHFEVETSTYGVEGERFVTDAILAETGETVEELTRVSLYTRLRKL